MCRQRLRVFLYQEIEHEHEQKATRSTDAGPTVKSRLMLHGEASTHDVHVCLHREPAASSEHPESCEVAVSPTARCTWATAFNTHQQRVK